MCCEGVHEGVNKTCVDHAELRNCDVPDVSACFVVDLVRSGDASLRARLDIVNIEVDFDKLLACRGANEVCDGLLSMFCAEEPPVVCRSGTGWAGAACDSRAADDCDLPSVDE